MKLKVKAYKLFKEHNLVNDYKEYVELVRLRCMWINDQRIEIPTKKLEFQDEIKHIKAGFKKIEINKKRGSG